MTRLRLGGCPAALIVIAICALGTAPGCDGDAGACQDGATQACTCPDGAAARQVCADQQWSACQPCDTPGPGAPVILSWALSGNALTPSTDILVSVVLTDPDGVDDIVGGTLVDSDGRAYGTFATAASEGSYEKRLTWDEVGATMSITGRDPSGVARPLKASFFDAEGHTTSRSFTLQARCDRETETPCAGTCVDLLQSPDNCGACGDVCAGSECAQGRCPRWSTCRPTGNAALDCAQVCGASGSACGVCELPEAPIAVSIAVSSDASCANVVAAVGACASAPQPGQWFRCCCM